MSKNLKLKKVNKSFVPEPKKRESSSVSSVFQIPLFMNICERFPYPYEYVDIPCSYLGRKFLDENILHRAVNEIKMGKKAKTKILLT